MTPIFMAAEKGHEAIVALLIQHGADIHRQNNIGEFPMSIATSRGRTTVVSVLIAKVQHRVLAHIAMRLLSLSIQLNS